MKNFSRLLILLLAFSLLSGCGGQPGYEPDLDGFGSYSNEVTSSAPDSSDSGVGPSDISESEQPVFQITEPPLNEMAQSQPVPDFLNAEQTQLFQHAFCAAGSFLMACGTAGVDDFPLADGSPAPREEYETIELDGMTYLVAQGRYRQWDDFQAMLDGLFTPEYQRELLGLDEEWAPIFRSNEDGLLCYIDAGRGSDIEYDWNEKPDTYELVSQTEDEIVFDLVGHYANFETAEFDEDGMPHPTEEYTQSFPIRMVRTAQGWRVAEIHVPW